MRKKLVSRRTVAALAITAGIAAIALMTAGGGFATPSAFAPGPYVSIAGTNLHQTPPIDSSSLTPDCSADDLSKISSGEVLWHFVLTQTTAQNSGLLRASFTSAGVTSPDVHFYKAVGGVLQWDVVTPSADTLEGASTDALGSLLNLSHVCFGDGGGSGQETSSISTTVHLGSTAADPAVVVDNANPAPLGSTVHDSADLEFSGGGTLPATSTVFFGFFHNGTCAGDPADISDPIDVSGASSPVAGLDPQLVKGPLGAGSYSYIVVFLSGDTSIVPDALGDCEPFTISKGDVSIGTTIHDASHNPVTFVQNGSVVHDTATVAGSLSGFDPNMSGVSFTFFTNGTCTPDGTGVATTGTESTFVARSADSAPLTSGQYSYSASFAGDDNYNPAGPATCEPLTVRTFGYTMGFWGNKNGQAMLAANSAFGANAVTLGSNSLTTCWVKVDSAAKSLTIFPSKLNGMSILTNCTAGNLLDSGINTGSLNTLLGQTLALSYNILYKGSFAGQPIGGMGCTAVGTLTPASTVENARDYANSLIANAKKGGTVVTQSQIGGANTLLGCLNAES